MPSKSEIKKKTKSSIKSSQVVAASKAITPKLTKNKVAKKSAVKIAPMITKSAKAATKSKKKITRSKILAENTTVLKVKKITPSIEEITARAHQIWLNQGCPEGQADIHWHQAESELSVN